MKPPPLVVKAKPPEPERARWLFASTGRGLTGKLDLGDGRTLYVGRGGRRVIAKGDSLEDAPVLALDDLAGVMRDAKGGYVFVADDGDIYRSSEPLGPLGKAQPGPLGTEPKEGEHVSAIATGRASAIAILQDGKVMRTSDFGTSWKVVDYAGSSKPFGRAASIALDSKGNGVLVHLPQRLFVTHDDGATWAPIASPNIGAYRVGRDGADRVWLRGYGEKLARLDGQALVATTDEPVEIYEAPKQSASPNKAGYERGERRTLLAGDHVVEIEEIVRHGAVRDIEVTSTKLGEKPGQPVSVPDLVGASDRSSMRVAAHGKTVLFLREDEPDDDAATPTSTLFVSEDYGATWKKGASFPGATSSSRADLDLAAGPKGWTYVASLCPHDRSSEDECSKGQIRPAGATSFEDMAFTEEFALRDVTFDEAHDRVYAVGTHEGHKYVYESPMSQNKFARTKLLEASEYGSVDISVDPTGAVRVLEWDHDKDAWALHRRGADGKEMPLEYLPLERGSVAFAGPRGFMSIGHELGYETADGGETWMRVATNGYSSNLQCTDSGCLTGGAQRVGWDIPAVQDQPKVTAQAEPPTPKKTYGGHTLPTPPLPQVQLTCKPAGTPSTLAQMPSAELLDDRTPELRWASVKYESDGRSSVIVANKTRVRELPLLAAEPKQKPGAKTEPLEVRNGERVLDDGVVMARYSFVCRSNRGAAFNPVDIDLAWWSEATGRTVQKTLPKVKAFRVSRFGFSGIPQIIDGGLLFQTQPQEPAYFIHDDGKVETITLPQGSTVNNSERAGKRWLLADADDGNVQISWSDDGGKAWKQRIWGLGMGRGEPSLTLVADKPVIELRSDPTTTLMFAVDASPPDDPPAPEVINPLVADAACDAHASRARFLTSIPYDHRSLHARIVGVDKDKTETQFTVETRVAHQAAGKMCTAAYVFSGYGRNGHEAAFLYPEAGGWTGWRFTRNAEPHGKTTYAAQPLTCQ